MPDLTPDLSATSAMSANAPKSFGEWNTWSQEEVDSMGLPQEFVGLHKYANQGYNIGERIMNFFTGDADRARDEYNRYLAENNRQYELQNVSDSRKWQEYMNSTQYQRMAKDLKAAGFNPGVVLSGGISAAGTPSTYTPGSRDETSARQMNSNLASQGDAMLGKVATTAMMVLGMVASRSLMLAAKTSKSERLTQALAKALDY